MSDLIYDLGLHRGEDTEFYLKKGFRVVAVDANEALCRQVAENLNSQIASGQLTIVNVAIAEAPGEVCFYHSDLSEWGTVSPDWAARNERLGVQNNAVRRVKATTLAALIEEHGEPHFIKIDIEGMDMTALRSLREAPAKPKYVSIESDKVSFRELRREFETFLDLGYDRFKLVPQRAVPRQKLPNPAREGKYVRHRFIGGSSGAFGEEAPGKWLTAAEAIEAYRPVFLRYALTGDDPFIRSRLLRNGLKALGMRTNWYDTHARRNERNGF